MSKKYGGSGSYYLVRQLATSGTYLGSTLRLVVMPYNTVEAILCANFFLVLSSRLELLKLSCQVNCVDLLWSSILAGMTSGTPEDAAEEGGEPRLLEDGADGAALVSAVQEQQQA